MNWAALRKVRILWPATPSGWIGFTLALLGEIAIAAVVVYALFFRA